LIYLEKVSAADVSVENLKAAMDSS